MNSTASLALIDTGPGWLVTLAVVAAFLIGVAVKSAFRKAATSQDTGIEYALNCDAYCAVVVCGAPATGLVHGWATCDEHRVTR